MLYYVWKYNNYLVSWLYKITPYNGTNFVVQSQSQIGHSIVIFVFIFLIFSHLYTKFKY